MVRKPSFSSGTEVGGMRRLLSGRSAIIPDGRNASTRSARMALAYPTLPGDIDHLIADGHAVVERQFQHLEAGRGNRRVPVDQISFELAVHAFAEETVLYPIWKEIGMEDERDDAGHEHQEINELLVVLGRTEPGQPEFEQALTELMEVALRLVSSRPAP
jgi:hypothetical protein